MRKDGTRRFTHAIGNPNDARGLYAAMRRYLEYLAVRGYTDQGRYNVERYIRDFIGWADARSVTHPQHVTHSVLERYHRALHYHRKKDGASLSITSQRAKLVPLRGLFKWLTRSGELSANPASELELPRRIRRLPAFVLSAGEAERVLAGADTGGLIGLRDRAMMEVLYSTGMRRMELARLTLTDIDFEREVVLIRLGKGNKDRMIPIGKRALHWVRQYLDRARPALAWNVGGIGPVPGAVRRVAQPFLAVDDGGAVRGEGAGGQAWWLPFVPAHDGDLDAGRRGRYPLYTGDAGTCGAVDHADLYAGGDPAAAGDSCGDPSGGAGLRARADAAGVDAGVDDASAEELLAALALEANEDNE
jgi:site-specific recombinase XerD